MRAVMSVPPPTPAWVTTSIGCDGEFLLGAAPRRRRARGGSGGERRERLQAWLHGVSFPCSWRLSAAARGIVSARSPPLSTQARLIFPGPDGRVCALCVKGRSHAVQTCVPGALALHRARPHARPLRPDLRAPARRLGRRTSSRSRCRRGSRRATRRAGRATAPTSRTCTATSAAHASTSRPPPGVEILQAPRRARPTSSSRTTGPT